MMNWKRLTLTLTWFTMAKGSSDVINWCNLKWCSKHLLLGADTHLRNYNIVRLLPDLFLFLFLFYKQYLFCLPLNTRKYHGFWGRFSLTVKRIWFVCIAGSGIRITRRYCSTDWQICTCKQEFESFSRVQLHKHLFALISFTPETH